MNSNMIHGDFLCARQRQDDYQATTDDKNQTR